MADRYLYSENATPVAPFDTPETAANTLAEILALTEGDVVAKDETIWVHASHAEERPETYSIPSPEAADAESPQKLLCVDNFTDKNLSSGAKISCASGGNRFLCFHGIWYLHGIGFHGNLRDAGVGNLTSSLYDSGSFYLKDCAYLGSGFANVAFGGGTGNFTYPSYVYAENFTHNVINTGARIVLGQGNKILHSIQLDITTAKPTYLFLISAPGQAEILNSDFSALDTNTLAIVYGGNNHIIRFVNCAFPTGVPILAGAERHQPKVYLVNSSSGNVNYDWQLHTFEGTITLDTSVYATTSPALFETATPYSLKMETVNNVSQCFPLYSEWIHKWHDAGTHTIDVECLVGADGADALKTCELYLEVDYISGVNSPLGSRATTAPNILSTGTDNPAGTTAWTGDGYAVERTHKLSATLTTTKNGYIRYRVCLAKPETTVFFNPV